MPFESKVKTDCVWDNLENQIRNKVNEIAQGGGRNSHGAVTLANGTACQHCRAGDYRIFGTYAGGQFNFIGWGQHIGRGNGSYKVNLCNGGHTSAKTS